METNRISQSGGGKGWLLAVVIMIALAGLGFGGWYYFMKKSPEGGVCNSDNKCETSLKCANKICSSGKVGSSCGEKTDCTSTYCVNNKCSDGKAGSICSKYTDCGNGLNCKQGTCAQPPSYTEYFSTVKISKIKPGSAPGPNNMPVATTQFSNADSIEIDFSGVKSTTVGSFYYELVDPTTGEVAMTSKDRNPEDQVFNGQDRGTGTDLSGIAVGTYDLNIYFKDNLIYTTQITIS